VRRNPWRYKVVAFDLDGTLLRGEGFDFSWEAVWRELAFGKAIQSKLKRDYRQRSESDPSRANRIRAYQDWCEKACAQFTSRGLTRRQLKVLASNLRLTRNCREALTDLRAQGVVTAIISGGINTFLEDAFPDYHGYIDFVFINELLFGPTGALEGVHATAFDFQGKAEALDMVCERVGCTSAEVVFVGDHFNDEAIMLKVDKAIAYPPMDAVVSGVSHARIIEDDLMAILPHVLVE
jgi:HAD superfamily phosphoserine phosphatase-like hydrolase